MSIATEITALNTNLTAAKDAVTAKGGTVGDTGLAGLASEIATIPSGGGSTPSEWGRVWFKAFDADWAISNEYNCEISIDDKSALINFLYGGNTIFLNYQYDIQFETQDGGETWTLVNGGEYGTQVMLQDIGLSGSIIDPGDYASFYIEYAYTSYPSEVSMLELTENMFSTMGPENFTTSSAGTEIHFGGIVIPSTFITKFEVGTEVTALPNSFLIEAFNLTELDLSHAESLTTIGEAFMSQCSTFNQNITIPSTVTSIGPLFMWGCNQMVSTVNVGSIPATAIASNNNTFSVGNTIFPAYSTGITIAGATASDWIAKFPNRTSSPYRKLILGNA